MRRRSTVGGALEMFSLPFSLPLVPVFKNSPPCGSVRVRTLHYGSVRVKALRYGSVSIRSTG